MKALVIGAAGGFGGTVARELSRRGHDVKALVRPGGRKPEVPGATLVEGDALDLSALDAAAEGVDAIVWGFHLPYHQWVPGAVDSARITAEVAARHGATILVPGNVYGLGAPANGPATEETPHRPRSSLGEVRERIESIFEAATKRGARVIIVRAGDYLGPAAANTWFETMTSRALRGGAFIDPGVRGVPHAWAYLPDVAAAGIDLLERRAALAPFEVVHFAGFELDSNALLDAARRALGAANRRTVRMPFWLVRLASPFSALLRRALEVNYLWTEPVLLDGAKLRKLLPDFRPTSLDDAVVTTLTAIARRKGIQVPRALPLPA